MAKPISYRLLSFVILVGIALAGCDVIEPQDASKIADQLMTEEAQTATARPVTPSPTGSPTPTSSPTVSPTPPCKQVNASFKGPVVCKFVAVFVQEEYSTFYTVTAFDPAGGTLSYEWSNSNKCGQFLAANVASIQWAHPDSNLPGACPVQDIHPGTITVVIKSALGAVKCEYPNGSAPGDAAQCVNQ